MKLEAVELRRIRLELVSPFRTSFGSQLERDILLVHAFANGADGWGECVALAEPVYSSEYVDGAQHAIAHHLLPRLFAEPDLTAEKVGEVLHPIQGHRMAKACLEMAVLDAQLRSRGTSWGEHFGATKAEVDCGVSVGIHDSIPALLNTVEAYLAEGYRRVKLKIEPGWDYDAVKAVRQRWPEIPLQVDANTAYTLADARRLQRLDEFDLLLIEQPLPEEQVLAHAELQKQVQTPICLDESIVSAQAAADAIALGACRIINVKPGRVGGYLEGRRIHDVCQAHGVPVWMGGMLETGLGRAGNVALAALPNFTLPGDTSASGRYYRRDITEPFVMHEGRLRVPTGPGLGVTVDEPYLKELTTSVEVVRAGAAAVPA